MLVAKPNIYDVFLTVEIFLDPGPHIYINLEGASLLHVSPDTVSSSCESVSQ